MSSKVQQINEDVSVVVEGRTMTIKVKLGEGTPSSSGKSLVVATTRGNVPIATPDGVMRLGLNLYKPL